MKKLLLPLILLICSSCSSLSKGEKQLSPVFETIEDESGRKRSVLASRITGKPRYYMYVVYKNLMKDGSVQGDHFVYRNVGREELSLQELLYGKKSKGEKTN